MQYPIERGIDNMTNTARLVRGIALAIAGVIAILVIFGLAWGWASNDQSDSNASTPPQVPCSDPFGENCFKEVTVLLPSTSPSPPVTCDGLGLTAVFTGDMTSETIQADGLTFNKNAERAVIDVPAGTEVTAIIVGDVLVDVQGSALGQYKTSYFLPYYSWGRIGVVTVCLG